MKKKFFIFLILIIGIIVIVKYSKYKKSLVYTVEHIENEDYFPVMQNERYGVINRNGDIVVDPIYDVIEIPNPTKPLFICKNNYNVETKNYNVQVFDDSNNQLLYQYYIVEAIKLNNVENNGYYEKSVLKYKSNDKYGLINFDGKKITDAIYDSIEGFDYKEGLLLVKKSDKYGIININGATIIKENYDEIISDAYYTDNDKYQKSGYITGIKTADGIRYGYINYEGKQILKENFSEIYRIIEKKDDDNIYLVTFENGRAGVYRNNKRIIENSYEDILYNAAGDVLILQKNSKQGISKIDGTQIIPIEYDTIYVEENYINAQKGEDTERYGLDGKKEDNLEYICEQDVANGKYKIVFSKDSGYKVITPDGDALNDGYEYIQYLFDDYFFVSKNLKKGIVNVKGEVALEPKYNVVQKVGSFNIVQVIDSEKNTILFDKNIKQIAKGKAANIYNYDNYIKFKTENDVKYFDKEGKEISNSQLYPNNKLIAYKEKSKWGYKNKSGDVVVDAIYDFVTEFNKYGYAGIKLSGKWGVIKDDGSIIKEPTYSIENTNEPNFIGEYYKVDLGYGIPYYTK